MQRTARWIIMIIIIGHPLLFREQQQCARAKEAAGEREREINKLSPSTRPSLAAWPSLTVEVRGPAGPTRTGREQGLHPGLPSTAKRLTSSLKAKAPRPNPTRPDPTECHSCGHVECHGDNGVACDGAVSCWVARRIDFPPFPFPLPPHSHPLP